MAKKIVRLSESKLVDLIDKIVTEAVSIKKNSVIKEQKEVKKPAKRVRIKESELIDLIDKIVTEAMSSKKNNTVRDLEENPLNYFNSNDYQLVTDSQDVKEIHKYFPKSKKYDGFFVEVEDGDYSNVYGFFGIVPTMNKEIYKIV